MEIQVESQSSKTHHQLADKIYQHFADKKIPKSDYLYLRSAIHGFIAKPDPVLFHKLAELSIDHYWSRQVERYIQRQCFKHLLSTLRLPLSKHIQCDLLRLTKQQFTPVYQRKNFYQNVVNLALQNEMARTYGILMRVQLSVFGIKCHLGQKEEPQVTSLLLRNWLAKLADQLKVDRSQFAKLIESIDWTVLTYQLICTRLLQWGFKASQNEQFMRHLVYFYTSKELISYIEQCFKQLQDIKKIDRGRYLGFFKAIDLKGVKREAEQQVKNNKQKQDRNRVLQKMIGEINLLQKRLLEFERTQSSQLDKWLQLSLGLMQPELHRNEVQLEDEKQLAEKQYTAIYHWLGPKGMTSSNSISLLSCRTQNSDLYFYTAHYSNKREPIRLHLDKHVRQEPKASSSITILPEIHLRSKYVFSKEISCDWSYESLFLLHRTLGKDNHYIPYLKAKENNNKPSRFIINKIKQQQSSQFLYLHSAARKILLYEETQLYNWLPNAVLCLNLGLVPKNRLQSIAEQLLYTLNNMVESLACDKCVLSLIELLDKIQHSAIVPQIVSLLLQKFTTRSVRSALQSLSLSRESKFMFVRLVLSQFLNKLKRSGQRKQESIQSFFKKVVVHLNQNPAFNEAMKSKELLDIVQYSSNKLSLASLLFSEYRECSELQSLLIEKGIEVTKNIKENIVLVLKKAPRLLYQRVLSRMRARQFSQEQQCVWFQSLRDCRFIQVPTQIYMQVLNDGFFAASRFKIQVLIFKDYQFSLLGHLPLSFQPLNRALKQFVGTNFSKVEIQKLLKICDYRMDQFFRERTGAHLSIVLHKKLDQLHQQIARYRSYGARIKNYAEKDQQQFFEQWIDSLKRQRQFSPPAQLLNYFSFFQANDAIMKLALFEKLYSGAKGKQKYDSLVQTRISIERLAKEYNNPANTLQDNQFMFWNSELQALRELQILSAHFKSKCQVAYPFIEALYNLEEDRKLLAKFAAAVQVAKTRLIKVSEQNIKLFQQTSFKKESKRQQYQYVHRLAVRIKRQNLQLQDLGVRCFLGGYAMFKEAQSLYADYTEQVVQNIRSRMHEERVRIEDEVRRALDLVVQLKQCMGKSDSFQAEMRQALRFGKKLLRIEQSLELVNENKEQIAKIYQIVVNGAKKFTFDIMTVVKRSRLLIGQGSFQIQFGENEVMTHYEIKEEKEKLQLMIQEQSFQRAELSQTAIETLEASIKFNEIVSATLSIFQLGREAVELGFCWQEQFEFRLPEQQASLEKQARTFQAQLADWKRLLLLQYQKCFFLTYFSGIQLRELFQKLRQIIDRKCQSQGLIIGKLLGQLGLSTVEELISGIDDGQREECRRSNQGMLGVVVRLMDKRKEFLFKGLPGRRPQGRVKLMNVSESSFYLAIFDELELAEVNFDQVLVCHAHSTQYELLRFVNRALLDPCDRKYFLVGPEQLTVDLRNQFKQLLDNLLNREEDQRLCLDLVVITASANHITYAYLDQLNQFQRNIKSDLVSRKIKVDKRHSLANQEEVKAKLRARISQNLEIVVSQQSGSGKSFYIKQNAGSTHLVHLPIAGIVDKEEVFYRLQQFLRGREKATLAIEINRVKTQAILDQILAQLLIFRKLRSRGELQLPKGVKVFIELKNHKHYSFTAESKLKQVLPQPTKVAPPSAQGYDFFNDLAQFKKSYFISRVLYACDANLLDQITFEFDSDREIEGDQVNLEEIQHIFKQHYFAQLNRPNYRQFKTFISILFDNFRSLTGSSFFKQPQIQRLTKDIERLGNPQLLKLVAGLKSTIFKYTVSTARCYTDRSQHSSGMSQKIEEQPILLLANRNKQGEQDQTFSFYYHKQENVPDEIKFILACQNFTDLVRLQSKPSLQSLRQIFQGREVQPGELERMEGRLTGVRQEQPDFKLTKFNLYKQALIEQRVNCGIPVILQGETGVGKTMLIRHLAQSLHDQQFIHVNVHEGVRELDIRQRIREAEAIAARFHEEQQLKILELEQSLLTISGFAIEGDQFFVQQIQYLRAELKKAREKQVKRVWVFFDEFNTSDAVGYLSELLLERRFMGRQVRYPNIVFLAACNPFRRKDVKLSGLLNPRANSIEYQVNPMDQSMHDSMWDYSTLSPSEVKEYIAKMINVKVEPGVLHPAVQFIQMSHVSDPRLNLRDVARVNQIWHYLLSSLPTRPVSFSNKKLADSYNRMLKSVSLGTRSFLSAFNLAYCLKMELQRRLAYFRKLEQAFKIKQVSQLIELEQAGVLARIKLQPGIASNRALQQNFFACLVCCSIEKPIPIIIVGMPGCSKTLSLRQLRQNDWDGSDQFFRHLKRFQFRDFQGTNTCTSQNLKEHFLKIKKQCEHNRSLPKRQKEQDQELEDRLLFAFDEIGLAENSPFNPLKVMHEHLQVGVNEFAFVGISNWQLDASKNSRLLVIERLPPTEEDLVATSKTIFQSFTQTGQLPKQVHSLTKAIARSYTRFMRLYSQLAAREHDIANFFGLRDFYSLVRYVGQKLSRAKLLTDSEIAQNLLRGIMRNFNGRTGSTMLFKDCLKHQLTSNANGEFSSGFVRCCLQTFECTTDGIRVLSLVEQNLRYELKGPGDTNPDRCLMLIFKQPIAAHLIMQSIEQDRDSEQSRPKQGLAQMVIGSSYSHDKDSNEYDLMVLRNIKEIVAKGSLLMLKDVKNSIQTSLYDLLNKSFYKTSSNKLHYRIAMGANNYPHCIVGPTFNAFMFVHQDNLETLDPPFLNRFQKHYVLTENIFSRAQLQYLEQIQQWVRGLVPEVLQPLTLNHYFANVNKNTLRSLLYLQLGRSSGSLSEGKLSPESIKNIKRQLIRNATWDFQLYFQQKYQDCDSQNSRFVRQQLQSKMQLQQTLKLIKSSAHQKVGTGPRRLIVLTYDRRDLNQSRFSCKSVRPSQLRNEQELRSQIKKFFESAEKMIEFQFKQSDLVYFGQVQSLFRYYEGCYFNKHFRAVFTVLLERNSSYDSLELPFAHGFDQVFVDELRSEAKFKNLQLNCWRAFFNNPYFQFQEEIESCIEDAFSLFDFRFSDASPQTELRFFKYYKSLKGNAAFKDRFKYFVDKLSTQLKGQSFREVIYRGSNKKVFAQSTSTFQAYLQTVKEKLVLLMASFVKYLALNNWIYWFSCGGNDAEGNLLDRDLVQYGMSLISEGCEKAGLLEECAVVPVAGANLLAIGPMSVFPQFKQEQDLIFGTSNSQGLAQLFDQLNFCESSALQTVVSRINQVYARTQIQRVEGSQYLARAYRIQFAKSYAKYFRLKGSLLLTVQLLAGLADSLLESFGFMLKCHSLAEFMASLVEADYLVQEQIEEAFRTTKYSVIELGAAQKQAELLELLLGKATSKRLLIGHFEDQYIAGLVSQRLNSFIQACAIMPQSLEAVCLQNIVLMKSLFNVASVPFDPDLCRQQLLAGDYVDHLAQNANRYIEALCKKRQNGPQCQNLRKLQAQLIFPVLFTAKSLDKQSLSSACKSLSFSSHSRKLFDSAFGKYLGGQWAVQELLERVQQLQGKEQLWILTDQLQLSQFMSVAAVDYFTTKIKLQDNILDSTQFFRDFCNGYGQIAGSCLTNLVVIAYFKLFIQRYIKDIELNYHIEQIDKLLSWQQRICQTLRFYALKLFYRKFGSSLKELSLAKDQYNLGWMQKFQLTTPKKVDKKTKMLQILDLCLSQKEIQKLSPRQKQLVQASRSLIRQFGQLGIQATYFVLKLFESKTPLANLFLNEGQLCDPDKIKFEADNKFIFGQLKNRQIQIVNQYLLDKSKLRLYYCSQSCKKLHSGTESICQMCYCKHDKAYPAFPQLLELLEFCQDQKESLKQQTDIIQGDKKQQQVSSLQQNNIQQKQQLFQKKDKNDSDQLKIYRQAKERCQKAYQVMLQRNLLQQLVLTHTRRQCYIQGRVSQLTGFNLLWLTQQKATGTQSLLNYLYSAVLMFSSQLHRKQDQVKQFYELAQSWRNQMVQLNNLSRAKSHYQVIALANFMAGFSCEDKLTAEVVRFYQVEEELTNELVRLQEGSDLVYPLYQRKSQISLDLAESSWSRDFFDTELQSAFARLTPCIESESEDIQKMFPFFRGIQERLNEQFVDRSLAYISLFRLMPQHDPVSLAQDAKYFKSYLAYDYLANQQVYKELVALHSVVMFLNRVNQLLAYGVSRAGAQQLKLQQWLRQLTQKNVISSKQISEFEANWVRVSNLPAPVKLIDFAFERDKARGRANLDLIKKFADTQNAIIKRIQQARKGLGQSRLFKEEAIIPTSARARDLILVPTELFWSQLQSSLNYDVRYGQSKFIVDWQKIQFFMLSKCSGRRLLVADSSSYPTTQFSQTALNSSYYCDLFARARRAQTKGVRRPVKEASKRELRRMMASLQKILVHQLIFQDAVLNLEQFAKEHQLVYYCQLQNYKDWPMNHICQLYQELEAKTIEDSFALLDSAFKSRLPAHLVQSVAAVKQHLEGGGGAGLQKFMTALGRSVARLFLVSGPTNNRGLEQELLLPILEKRTDFWPIGQKLDFLSEEPLSRLKELQCCHVCQLHLKLKTVFIARNEQSTVLLNSLSRKKTRTQRRYQ